MESWMASEPALHLLMFVRGIIVHDHVDLLAGRNHVLDGPQELQPFLMAMLLVVHGNHLALKCVNSGKQRGRAVALIVVGHRSTAAFFHRQARLRPIQSLNLTLLIGAQNDGVLGGIQVFRYRPTMSSSFSQNSGSRLSLKVRTRCGFSPCARQMRRTLASLMPAAAAMVRVLQCVAWAGFSRSVISTTFFTRRSVMIRARPGRGASFFRAAVPPLRKRFRQRATFSGVMPIRCAICWFSRPSAACNTIRARSTTRAGSERCLAHRSSSFLCSGLRSTGGAIRIPRPPWYMDARLLIIDANYDALH